MGTYECTSLTELGSFLINAFTDIAVCTLVRRSCTQSQSHTRARELAHGCSAARAKSSRPNCVYLYAVYPSSVGLELDAIVEPGSVAAPAAAASSAPPEILNEVTSGTAVVRGEAAAAPSLPNIMPLPSAADRSFVG